MAGKNYKQGSTDADFLVWSTDSSTADVGVTADPVEYEGVAGVEESKGSITHNMKHLVNEFKGLYESKLSNLRGPDENSEGNMKIKIRILQSYINDLSVQNKVLVQTVEDLEKEASEKVGCLSSQLRRADHLLNNLQVKLRKRNEMVEHLNEENSDLKTDIGVLIEAIKQARITQTFDLSSLKMKTAYAEQAFRVASCSMDIISRLMTSECWSSVFS